MLFRSWFTRQGVLPGEASAVNSGTMWGLYHGGILQDLLQFETRFTTDANGFETQQSGLSRSDKEALTVLASQTVGTAAGIAIATQLHPTAGSVSLVNSAGIWANAATLLFIGASGWDVKAEQLEKALLATTDMAMLGGAWAASKVTEIGRAHV